jgi:hypothetical protein
VAGFLLRQLRRCRRPAIHARSALTEPEIQITSLDPDAGMFQTLRRDLGVTSFGINAMTLQPKQRLRVPAPWCGCRLSCDAS